MAVLEEPSKASIVKLLLIGDSGTGKTGALASLVRAGFQLRILDMDNKVAGGILQHLFKGDPEALSRINYISLRDKFKSSPAGPIPEGIPKAFNEAMKYMDKWDDGSVPSQWGPDVVFVVDSFTFLANAAWDWAKAMNPGTKEPRTWFYTAQQVSEDALSLLTNEAFDTNVIVISHINYMQLADGMTKGLPSGIGKALSPKIPSYFENLGVVSNVPGGKRQISFVPTNFIDAKTPLLDVTTPLPHDTGLATFFEKARS